MKVTCEIKEYSEMVGRNIKINNHFSYRNLLEIEVDGKRYVVDGREMKTAIDNCMNTGV